MSSRVPAGPWALCQTRPSRGTGIAARESNLDIPMEARVIELRAFRGADLVSHGPGAVPLDEDGAALGVPIRAVVHGCAGTKPRQGGRAGATQQTSPVRSPRGKLPPRSGSRL